MKFSAVKSSTLDSRVPLLLHFDINKTIIITDSALDLSIDQALNSLLSECIWGTLKKNRDKFEADNISGSRADKMTDVELRPRSYLKTGTRNENNSDDDVVDSYKWSVSDWKICSPLPSKNAPQADSVTFNEFVENFHFDERMTKTKRRLFKRRFTEKGMPGEEALGSFQILEGAMKFPAQKFETESNSDSNDVGDKVERRSDSVVVSEETRGDNGSDNRIESCINSTNKNCNNNENERMMENDSNDEISDKKRKIDRMQKISMENDLVESNIGQILKSGYYHILPSFFKLVSYLHHLNVDFRIIFRTFGIDVEKVSEEFNIYCEGRHPLFPIEKNPIKMEDDKVTESYSEYHTVERVKMDGENGADRRLHFPYFCGVIKRTSERPEGMSLSHTNILGDTETVHGSKEIFQKINEWFSPSNTGDERNCENTTVAIQNTKKVSKTIRIKKSTKNDINGKGSENGKSYIDSTFSPFTVAIQDDFSYWDACGESDESGKVFMVDTDTEKKRNRDYNCETANGQTSEKSEVASNSTTYIQLFFDDNVERFRSHIVDVRTASTFEPIPFKLSENIFVKKVETYFAITDENYFIDLVEEMVSAQINYMKNLT